MIRHSSLLTGFLIAAAAVLVPEGTTAQIPVGNVEELYTAVNDPTKAGMTVSLAPGVYMLSASDPFGAARPNGGRLDLQANMSLVGVDGDRSAVVVDATNLPANSYLVGTRRVAAVRIGRGRNSIEWLTIRNALFGTANIDTTLQSPGTAFVTIAHIASTGSQRGLDVLNFGPLGGNGETIEADIIDSDFYSNLAGNPPNQGVRVVNFSATGSVINVRMTGNRAWGQTSGALLAGNQSTNSTIRAYFSGNRFYNNGLGLFILGGNSAQPTFANGNTIDFEAHGDHYVDNTAPFFGNFGGLVVLGGQAGIANRVNNNTVNVALWGCRMQGNNTWDLIGVGAVSTPESIGSPGANNSVTIRIHGEGDGRGRWQPNEFFADSLPNDPGTTNSVTVIR